MRYEKARKLSLDEIIPYIATTAKHASRSFWCPAIKRCVVVSLATARIRLFVAQECAACKIKADHIWIERNPYCGAGSGWHLNMYALNYHGDSVMLTLDHIKPRSKGGIRSKNNVQLLCNNCNSFKGDHRWSLKELAARRASKDDVLHKSLVQAGILPVCQYQSMANEPRTDMASTQQSSCVSNTFPLT